MPYTHNFMNIVYLKTIRTASTSNLLVFKRLMATECIDRVYCVAEDDNLKSKEADLYLSNQHSSIDRTVDVLNKLDSDIWPSALKVSTTRDALDQIVSIFWRSYYNLHSGDQDIKKYPNRAAFLTHTNDRMLPEIKNKAQDIFNACISNLYDNRQILIRGRDNIVTSTDEYTDMLNDVTNTDNDIINILCKDIIFSIYRTSEVLYSKTLDIAPDVVIKYEDMETGWRAVLSKLKINYDHLVEQHKELFINREQIKDTFGISRPPGWGNLYTLINNNNKITTHSSDSKEWYENQKHITFIKTLTE